jgi:hypothetical protein
MIKEVCVSLAADRFPDDPTVDPFNPPLDYRFAAYANIIFTRFLEAHDQEMWVFAAPDITLRAHKDILFQAKFYIGQCPENQEAGKEIYDDGLRYPRFFLTPLMRVTTRLPDEEVARWNLEEFVLEAKKLEGALVCWKPNQGHLDLEKTLRRFTDEVYWAHLTTPMSPSVSESTRAGLRVTLDEFYAVCPNGKAASGLTWDEVQSKSGWSRRQIMRALSEFGDKPANS